jgi:hypothetical protein
MQFLFPFISHSLLSGNATLLVTLYLGFLVLVKFLSYFSCASSEKGCVLLFCYSDIPITATVGTARGYTSVAASVSQGLYRLLGRFEVHVV